MQWTRVVRSPATLIVRYSVVLSEKHAVARCVADKLKLERQAWHTARLRVVRASCAGGLPTLLTRFTVWPCRIRLLLYVSLPCNFRKTILVYFLIRLIDAFPSEWMHQIDCHEELLSFSPFITSTSGEEGTAKKLELRNNYRGFLVCSTISWPWKFFMERMVPLLLMLSSC